MYRLPPLTTGHQAGRRIESTARCAQRFDANNGRTITLRCITSSTSPAHKDFKGNVHAHQPRRIARSRVFRNDYRRWGLHCFIRPLGRRPNVVRNRNRSRAGIGYRRSDLDFRCGCVSKSRWLLFEIKVHLEVRTAKILRLHYVPAMVAC